MKSCLPPLCLLALLAGCAADAVPVSYYLLAPPPQTAASRQDQSTPTLVIETLELASYLRQAGLVMQTGDHQLQVSRTHLWAENLEQALPRALQQQLQRQADGYAVYIRLADFIARTDYRLRLRIDSMQATDQGDVILAGSYQLISAADPGNPLDVTFFFRRDLVQDGYAHAVDQLQGLVGELGASVLAALDDLASTGNVQAGATPVR